jgi:hypothetical protein
MEVLPGVYRHWKGKFYLVTGEVRDDDTEEIKVLYVPLYKVEGANTRQSTRKINIFTELVQWPDGQMRPRFVREDYA